MKFNTANVAVHNMAETRFEYPRSPEPSQQTSLMIVTVIVGLALAAGIVLLAHWLGDRAGGGRASGDVIPLQQRGTTYP